MYYVNIQVILNHIFPFDKGTNMPAKSQALIYNS